jgi:hypothetical protein
MAKFSKLNILLNNPYNTKLETGKDKNTKKSGIRRISILEKKYNTTPIICKPILS